MMSLIVEPHPREFHNLIAERAFLHLVGRTVTVNRQLREAFPTSSTKDDLWLLKMRVFVMHFQSPVKCVDPFLLRA